MPEVPEGGAPYVVVPYADRMELAYAAADLVVARSGANTVCELTAVGLPAVYVPLPIGNGEQRLNAAEVVAAGGGILVEDAALTPEWVQAHVLPLATDDEQLAHMTQAAARLGERAADEALADLVDEAWRLASMTRSAPLLSSLSRQPDSTSPHRSRELRSSAGSTSSRSGAPACPVLRASCSPAASR